MGHAEKKRVDTVAIAAHRAQDNVAARGGADNDSAEGEGRAAVLDHGTRSAICKQNGTTVFAK